MHQLLWLVHLLFLNALFDSQSLKRKKEKLYQKVQLLFLERVMDCVAIATLASHTLVAPAKNSPPDCFLNTLFDSQSLKRKKEKLYQKVQLLFLERVMGIEPTRPAWKAGILPLNYTRV